MLIRIAACVILIPWIAPAAAFAQISQMTAEQLEAEGIEVSTSAPPAGMIATGTTLTGTVLLIPDSTSDVVAAFDPFDGHYLGDLINGLGIFSTPINAIQGPDGNIYVSDQLLDAVLIFDRRGTMIGTYADSTDGLDNIRGIDFFNGNLFVTSGGDYVAEFSGPHVRLADHINIPGVDPFDIHFLPDGSSLLGDIGNNNVTRFKADGTIDSVLFSVSFPEQVTTDSLAPGEFFSTAFTSDRIDDFSLDGTIHQSTPLSTSGRGVYRLGNGNLLSAGSAGVQELAPGTGTVINQVRTGSGWRYIEEVSLNGWTSLGNDLPGSLGSPVLLGDGALSAGTTVTLSLTNAAPNSTANLIVGASALNAPFFGGTLVPFPNLILAIPTGATGSAVIPAVYPAGIPAGFPVYVQYWIVDPTGPQGYTASNALTATTQ